MKRTAAITIAIAGLFLAGCGSDSTTKEGATDTQAEAADVSSTQAEAADATDIGGAQAKAAQSAIDSAAEQGVTLDEECVNEIASRLSDADAEIIAKGDVGDGEVSAEGAALSLELIGCLDEDALVDLFVEGMNQSGQNFDEDCVREKLEDFDVAEIVAASQEAEPPADVVAALSECASGG